MADRARPRRAAATRAVPATDAASARVAVPGEAPAPAAPATRAVLVARLGVLLRAAARAGPPPGLIELDLDRFDEMNDGLGPSLCDTLLRRVALRLRAIVPDALLARTSGSRFAVLLADGQTAARVAARVREVVRRPYAIAGHAVTLDVSVGVAVAGPGERDALRVLHAAGLALHQAQRDGHGCIRHFDPSMYERAVHRVALEADFRAAITLQRIELRRALSNEQFQLDYQPQVALADGRLTGFEALLRWHHPDRGMVAPDLFVPLAEETGLIVLLGEWVLRAACRDAAAWPFAPGGVPLRIAVNVSPLQLRDGGGLLAAIDRALADSGLAAARLEIELTETALADDIGATLAAIRARGCPLALDDFGTGHSSLSRLHGYPFTRLKIDRAFIADLDPGPGAPAASRERLVKAIVGLGLGLGLGVTIEGVETPYQRDVARRAGCDEVQGFLVSPPLPRGAVADFIRRFDPPSPADVATDDR